MTYRTIIIPASEHAMSKQLCEGLAGEAGGGMFLTGLSPTGNEPATHYISAGHISDEMASILPCKHVAKDKDGKDVITVNPGLPDAVPALAAKAKITVTKAEVTALYSKIDVSDEDPFSAMDRLGLQMASAKQEALA